MDRTIRMMRRTLLCAAFACPLSLFGLWPACAVLFLFSLSMCFQPAVPSVWICKNRPPYARIAFSFSAGIFASAVLHTAVQAAFLPLHAPSAAILRLLSTLTGISLQCALLGRVRFVRKAHILLLVLFLFGFIVCMQSGA